MLLQSSVLMVNLSNYTIQMSSDQCLNKVAFGRKLQLHNRVQPIKQKKKQANLLFGLGGIKSFLVELGRSPAGAPVVLRARVWGWCRLVRTQVKTGRLRAVGAQSAGTV